MALTLRAAEAAELRAIVTPEGVPLSIRVATLADRVAAFAIDFVIVAATFVVVSLAIFLLRDGLGRSAMSLHTLFVFLLMNGYFIWFELRTSGQTPGKRAVGIRVLARNGGPLRADAVFARNLVRDIEVFLPLVVVCFKDAVFPHSSGWTWPLAAAWLLVCACVPAFNRERLRIGDLIGGTWVVRAPRVLLRPDLARRATSGLAGAGATGESAPEFTRAQLDVYGIYELQTLEDVLRNPGAQAHRLRAVVAGKIARKIGAPPPTDGEAEAFLRRFYAALRAHLEQRMLFGARKERKDA